MTTTPMRAGARAAVVAPAVVLAAALGTAGLLAGPTLPERIATHFSFDGTPDGWSSPWPVFWGTLLVAVAGIVLAVLALRWRDRRTAAVAVLVANLLVGVLVGTWTTLAVVNRSAAPTLSGWWVLPSLAVAAVAAAVPTLVLVRHAAPVPAHDVAPLDVAPDARVAWRASVGSVLFAVLGVVLVALGIAAVVWATSLGAGSATVTAVVVLVVGLTVLLLARVEVTVDRRGLRLTSTWTRIPLMRVPLERIESAGWEQVSPGQWGGWGYRVSGRGIAYVARSGPGLVARLRGGQARMVTVDDAERGAAALGALLAARR